MVQKNIEFTFDPQELRIIRTITDSDGNVIDERNAEPSDAAEVDEAIIEDIVSYAETNHPNLFGTVRDMTPEQILDLRVKVMRMAESLRVYARYKDLQIQRQEKQAQEEQSEMAVEE